MCPGNWLGWICGHPVFVIFLSYAVVSSPPCCVLLNISEDEDGPLAAVPAMLCSVSECLSVIASLHVLPAGLTVICDWVEMH